MTAAFDIQAPAKLNLFLHVTGRRDDGYHLLQSLFVPIALYDSLSFKINEGGRVRRLSEIAGIAEADDLVIKAAGLLKAHCGRAELGVDIELQKVIPSGAGLGGGSSDAAATLLALNTLWDLQLSKEQLLPLALSLGADVPFFLYAMPAIVEGIGEQITILPNDLTTSLGDTHYVLFIPQLAIPTVSIFKAPNLKRDTPRLTQQQLVSELSRAAPVWHYGHNDLQAVACAQHLALDSLSRFLLEQGINARMSGAGSVFFAAFATKEQASMAQQQVSGAYAELILAEPENPLSALQLCCLTVAAHPLQ
ncbi:MAG: 4-(cytidine 5'-diphospho)-2-C-methyl-D-erythritol kinase [Alcaligenaceae bacterium]|nr:4-(cytidine 5'-diphospho)-2-C-methyl-D-erythritol kinase [Alcaligenaceae bacterium]